jgi:hypothetical protein
MAVVKFKHREKHPADPLEASDPMPDYLDPAERLIYLRIIRESEKGVLLQADRIAAALAAQTTAAALAADDGAAFVSNIEEIYAALLLPELAREYINQLSR